MSLFPKAIAEINAMQFNWMSSSLRTSDLPYVLFLDFRTFEVVTTIGYFKKLRGQNSPSPEFHGAQRSCWHMWCLVAAPLKPERNSIKNQEVVSWHLI